MTALLSASESYPPYTINVLGSLLRLGGERDRSREKKAMKREVQSRKGKGKEAGRGREEVGKNRDR